MKKLFSLCGIISLLAGLALADPVDVTPEEAMEKLKAKQEARRLAASAATQSAASTELITVRAVNAELRTENAALKETIDRLKAEIVAKDRLIADAAKKARANENASAKTSGKTGGSIFDVEDGKK